MKLPVSPASAIALCLAATIVSAPALAGELYVAVNGETGDIVVAGNSPDAGEQVRARTQAIRPTGWDLLFADDAPGWATVGCVKTATGYYFEIASGHPVAATATSLARAAAERYVSRNGGRVIPDCAPAWNNDGQLIASTSSAAKAAMAGGGAPSAGPAKGGSAPPVPGSGSRSGQGGKSVAQETGNRTKGTGKLGSTPIEAPPPPTLVRSAPKPPPAPPADTDAGAGQLRCRLPSDETHFYRDCEQDKKVPPKGKPGAGKKSTTTKVPPLPKRAGMDLHREAVTICEFVEPQSRFGNWRCIGDLQLNYINFDKPSWERELAFTTVNDNGRRDLGMVGGFRVFGWNFPVGIHPDDDEDAAIKFGVPNIPGRLNYFCPKGSRKGCTRV